MPRSTKWITLSAFIAMFFLGVGTTIIGAAARNIGLTPSQIGILLAAQNLGFMLSVIISGTLSDVYDKTKILFIGSLVLACSFFAFYLKNVFLLNLLVMFFIGIGMGTYEGVTDAMLLDIHKQREGLYINVNHFFVTFGCIMITLYLLFLQMNWRRSLNQSALAVLILALYFAFTSLKSENKAVDRLSDRLAFLRQQKIVMILFFATICATGMELCLIGIMTTFLMELRGFSQATSKIGLIIFLAGIALGRLLVGFLTKREEILNLIILFFGLSTLFLGGLFLVNAKGLNYFLVFLSGAAISALFPLLITLGGIMYKEIPGTVLGIIKLALPTGGVLIPILLSLISGYGSLQLALMLFPAIALAGFIILFTNRRAFSC